MVFKKGYIMSETHKKNLSKSWDYNKHFTEECRKKLSISRIKRESGAKGKHWKVKDTSNMKKHCGVYIRTDEIRKNMSNAKRGHKNCLGKHWKIKDTSKMHHSSYLKNKTFEECYGKEKAKELKENKSKFMKKRVGNISSHWKGGITPLNHKIRTSFEYNDLVKKCMIRDNFTCQICGKKNVWLEIHHIKSFRDIITEYKINSWECSLKCIILWDINNGVTLCKPCHAEINKYRKIKCEGVETDKFFKKFTYNKNLILSFEEIGGEDDN